MDSDRRDSFIQWRRGQVRINLFWGYSSRISQVSFVFILIDLSAFYTEYYLPNIL